VNRKTYAFAAGLLTLALLAACGGTPQEVVVTVEVPVTVAAPAGTPVQVPVTFAEAGETLQTVMGRGRLICGGNNAVPGFGYIAPGTEEFAGFDSDFCRALAAAIFDDPTAVEIVHTTGQSRFPALQSGEVDVLIRNTTWTISRDTQLGFDFGPTTFYDGQGMMARIEDGFETLEDLEGGTVCVQQGTTTELNLADVMNFLGVDYEPLVLPDAAATLAAYDEGRCDAMTTDKSGLIGQKTLTADPDAHVIMDVTMSKEPLGPLTRHGDNNWGDIVSWVTYCTFAGEEYDITSENVDDMLGSDDPVIQNILGVTGDLGLSMGLTADFCARVIRHVGNYGEIYNRNLGPDTPYNVPRGLNSLYTEGGLLYAPPFR
jgi:general L-amino acid transport system substrate-binding protein